MGKPSRAVVPAVLIAAGTLMVSGCGSGDSTAGGAGSGGHSSASAPPHSSGDPVSSAEASAPHSSTGSGGSAESSAASPSTVHSSPSAGHATGKPHAGKKAPSKPRHADAAGPDGAIPASCSISRSEVKFLSRDWSRVAGSIGREDHSKYTKAFKSDVEKLVNKDDGCPGAKNLEKLSKTVNVINKNASSGGSIQYAKYSSAEKSGNLWLDKMGFTTIRMMSA